MRGTSEGGTRRNSPEMWNSPDLPLDHRCDSAGFRHQLIVHQNLVARSEGWPQMPQYPYHILIWPIVQDPPQQKYFALRRLVSQKIVNLKPHPLPYVLVNVITQSCHLNNFWKILHNEAQVSVSLRDCHTDMSLGASNIDYGAVRWDIGPRVAGSEVVRRLPCV